MSQHRKSTPGMSDCENSDAGKGAKSAGGSGMLRRLYFMVFVLRHGMVTFAF